MFRDKLFSYYGVRSGKPHIQTKDFVHLHLHTDYSLLQSTIQLKPLARKLAEHDMKACAITDYGNMYGAVSFYNTMKYAGFRPDHRIRGVVAYGSRFDQSLNIPAGEGLTIISFCWLKISRATESRSSCFESVYRGLSS